MTTAARCCSPASGGRVEELVIGYWSLVIGYLAWRMTNDQRPITNDQSLSFVPTPEGGTSA